MGWWVMGGVVKLLGSEVNFGSWGCTLVEPCEGLRGFVWESVRLKDPAMEAGKWWEGEMLPGSSCCCF